MHNQNPASLLYNLFIASAFQLEILNKIITACTDLWQLSNYMSNVIVLPYIIYDISYMPEILITIGTKYACNLEKIRDQIFMLAMSVTIGTIHAVSDGDQICLR